MDAYFVISHVDVIEGKTQKLIGGIYMLSDLSSLSYIDMESLAFDLWQTNLLPFRFIDLVEVLFHEESS